MNPTYVPVPGTLTTSLHQISATGLLHMHSTCAQRSCKPDHIFKIFSFAYQLWYSPHIDFTFI